MSFLLNNSRIEELWKGEISGLDSQIVTQVVKKHFDNDLTPHSERMHATHREEEHLVT